MGRKRGLDPEIQGLLDELEAQGSAERKVKEKAYLKSELEHLGTSVPLIRKATKAFAKRQGLDHAGLWQTVDALWGTGIHEARVAAVELLHHHHLDLTPDDLPRLETLLRECKTWALLDALAINTVGKLVARHPEMVEELDRFAEDEDFWIRRTAMLALLLPLRRGEGDWTRFIGYADAMLEEKEFFIRKAIGWVLRERSKPRPDQVYEWVAPRAKRMSGVTIREAVKKLPDAQRDELMAAYKSR